MSRDEAYLRHVLDAISRIASYTSVGRDEFFRWTHWQDAVIRQFETMLSSAGIAETSNDARHGQSSRMSVRYS